MSELELSPGVYQAEIASVVQPEGRPFSRPETIVFFRLTEPAEDDKKNPQSGLGGRIARAWFDLDAENPATQKDAEEKRDTLLGAVGRDDLDEAIGEVLWVRVARVVMRSDPSRYRAAVVEFIPLVQPVREFVR